MGNGTPRSFESQGDEYRRRREELRLAEIELKQRREQVAALRRQLPAEPVPEDYVLEEGPRDLAKHGPIEQRRLSQLFEDPSKPLVLLHFMYGKAQKEPCPMCTLWADGYSGILDHLAQHMNFAVAIAGELASFRSYARERGWQGLRIVSTAPSSLKSALGFEGEAGEQTPGVSVFTRGDDAVVRHFYSGGAMMGDDHYRGMDLLSPFWSFLDLTPAGRGEFFPSRSYEPS